MVDAALHPRQAEARLREALEDSPVVLVHGPRQCGKTTLAHQVGEHAGHGCATFDDDVLRSAGRGGQGRGHGP